MVDATITVYTTSNKSGYPFNVSGNQITSTNTSNNTSSTYTIKALEAFTLELQYKVSSEALYDKLTIKHNSSTKVTASGTSVTKFTSLSINMSAGDTVTITYSKDVSGRAGSDCAWVNILTPSTRTTQVEKTELTPINESNWESLASCTKDVICEICGEVAIEKIAHTEVIDEAVSPTCEKAGLTEGKHCSVCNEILLAQTDVAALGHTEVVDAGIAPTCTQTGITDGKHCSVCNEILVAQQIASVIGHNYEYGVCIMCGTEMAIEEYFEFTLQTSGNYTIKAKDVKNMPSKIVIPRTYNGKAVTAIGDDAFRNCHILTSVIIPDSIIAIFPAAFYGCYNITEISIPDSVTTIGNEAFAGCSLMSITIPSSAVLIYGDAFYGCTRLVEVINHSSINITVGNHIATYAIEVHNGKTSKIDKVDDYLFYTYNGINYLVGYVGNDANPILPESYNGKKYLIYNFAFSNCHNLTNVTIPNSVTSIGDSSFYGCNSLVSVDIPDSVTSIGHYAFSDCDSLTSIVIGNNVTSIGYRAFQNCSSLTSITIPNSVTSIGTFAFQGCSSLASITIGNNVTSINYKAFDGCSSLKDVYYTGSKEEWAKISIGSNNSDLTGATIHYNYVPEE